VAGLMTSIAAGPDGVTHIPSMNNLSRWWSWTLPLEFIVIWIILRRQRQK
jgi:hypothetical protein